MAESDESSNVRKDPDDPATDTEGQYNLSLSSVLSLPRPVKGTKLGDNGNPLHTLGTALDDVKAQGPDEDTVVRKGEEMTGKGLNEASGTDYMLVDNEKVLRMSLQLIKEAVKEEPVIALDCEGDDLSRKGKLLLMSVATRKKAFLIDILALNSIPFDLGFRTILEDENIKKLMFDCRSDSDALFHQFSVKLDGVLDIQLLEIIKRPPEPSTVRTKRRSERHDEVLKLRGQLWCMEHLLNDKEMAGKKKKGATIASDWGKRPLVADQLEYAKTDALSLFNLLDKLHPDEGEMKRLEIASGVYVDLKRSIVGRKHDRYEDHGYLPIDVIPENGRTGFDYGYAACVECKRRFPYEEFSKTQMKNHTQKCRTCKRIKEDIDKMKNRERQAENEEYEYVYYDSFDSDNGYGGNDSDFGCMGNDSDYGYAGYDSDY